MGHSGETERWRWDSAGGGTSAGILLEDQYDLVGARPSVGHDQQD